MKEEKEMVTERERTVLKIVKNMEREKLWMREKEKRKRERERER